MSGIYAELTELIQLRLKARNLQLFQSISAKSQLSGGILSPFKGRGMNFEEVRAYQAGDDIRTIDWRVTARRSKPHTKIFREERERPVMIILDQSHSLFFGSKLNFKSVTACETAALLAWGTLLHGDRIGGIIFNEIDHYNIRPKSAKTALMHFLKKAEKLNKQLQIKSMPTQQNQGYLANSLRHARRVAHPGTQLFIISDFRDMDSEALRQLAKLKRHCEIMAFQITDPLEQELPEPSCYVITNGIHRYTLDTRQRAHRQAFREQQFAQYQLLEKQLIQYRIPLIRLSSEEDTAEQLLLLFSSKSRPLLKRD
ncbi:MAG: DUF58 domain-containing protein [Endozoicomonas sp. (ex Botrylloides leachii)]|nr:DUF58 domain-containing protein [Endozoicomonas sp. (ex Botrylloides leachii)]